MLKDIEIEISSFKKLAFTGLVKIGLEHGSISSMSISTKLINIPENQNKDIITEIRNFCKDDNDFYGQVEILFENGNIKASNFTVNLQGEQLKQRLRKNKGKEVLQCRNV